MNEDKIAQLEQEIRRLRNILDKFVVEDRYEFNKNISHKGNKLAFYSKVPVAQPGSPNGKQDKSGSGGANVTDGTGYNGNTGSTYYTIGDIVYSLKILGLLN